MRQVVADEYGIEARTAFERALFEIVELRRKRDRLERLAILECPLAEPGERIGKIDRLEGRAIPERLVFDDFKRFWKFFKHKFLTVVESALPYAFESFGQIEVFERTVVLETRIAD